MPCPTFGNECLSEEGEEEGGGGRGRNGERRGGAVAGGVMKGKGKFGVLGVEVWCIGG
jgi:hypothetical protein